MKLLKPAVIFLCATLASCSPSYDELAPWPGQDGNYLQLHQSPSGEWLLTGAIVRSGKTTATALFKVEIPADPSSLLTQHVPLASIHVRGVDCESLVFKHLVVERGPNIDSYWMAIPRGRTVVKPSCQIKNPPEKWLFVDRG
ncbi:hypothetical protein [Pseudomonas aeruginosa]|uniref:hypothetical protein n=1 Tax=Pseudomonas aeruginosa TaxID=287 RepID=UPI003D27F3BD